MENKSLTASQLSEMDRKADIAVKAMVTGGILAGIAPVGFDIGAISLAMAGGVVAIGRSYAFELNKSEAAEIIKHFFTALGVSMTALIAGEKTAVSILKTTVVAYPIAALIDGTICGAVSFAVGVTSQNFFRTRKLGRTLNNAEIKKIMTDSFELGKKKAREETKEKIKELKKNKK